MNIVELEEIRLAGLSLPTKTTNDNGQSAIDCENLWHEFHRNYAGLITGKTGDEIYGVYHAYEGDHTKPFSYFIGCRVAAETAVPEGLQQLVIPGGAYQKISAKGKMPDCVSGAWREIWLANYPRTYQVDFEVYDERSKNWEDAEVDVYLSVKS